MPAQAIPAAGGRQERRLARPPEEAYDAVNLPTAHRITARTYPYIWEGPQQAFVSSQRYDILLDLKICAESLDSDTQT